jgi:hypothetical protein
MYSSNWFRYRCLQFYEKRTTKPSAGKEIRSKSSHTVLPAFLHKSVQFPAYCPKRGKTLDGPADIGKTHSRSILANDGTFTVPRLVFQELAMAKISKPDANPILALVLSLFWGLGHMIVNGQKQKFIMGLVVWLISYVLCCVPSIVVAILSIIDSYKTAEKLKAGKEIDENEYSFKPYYSIAKLIHKDAVFVE